MQYETINIKTLDKISRLNKLNKELQVENKQLQEKINKAIKYIKENIYEMTARFDGESQLKNGELDDLLKILKGE